MLCILRERVCAHWNAAPEDVAPSRKRPSLAGAIGEVSEWDAMRSPSKSIPRTPLGADGEILVPAKLFESQIACTFPGRWQAPLGRSASGTL